MKKAQIKFGWVYVAGEWRTKSKFKHWTFPIFPEWIKKYKLKEDFRMNQDLLRKKAKMNIVSAFDKTKTWTGEDPNDRGVCDNNSYCLLYTSPSPRDRQKSRMPSSA